MARIVGQSLLAAGTAAVVGIACRDSVSLRPVADISQSVLGTLVVSTSTTGAALDPDGYTVTVDGVKSQAIGTNGSATFDSLSAGNHSVALSGVAENCTVLGANPQTDSVPAGDTARATFAVSCAAVRATGLGQIGPDSAGYNSSYDTFSFDVRSDLTGKLVYTEYATRPDGPVFTLVVDPSDPATGITTFTPSSTVCADSTRGVEFDGISREDFNVDPLEIGQLVPFHVAACDNGPSGSGLDYFSFTVSRASYNRQGYLKSGDIAKYTYPP